MTENLSDFIAEAICKALSLDRLANGSSFLRYIREEQNLRVLSVEFRTAHHPTVHGTCGIAKSCNLVFVSDGKQSSVAVALPLPIKRESCIIGIPESP